MLGQQIEERRKLKGRCYVVTDYSFGALVWRRWGLLWVFKMGNRRRYGIVGTVLLIVLVLYLLGGLRV